MSTTIIVGDGPGSLSAALFLAKNGHQVTVIGDDKTAVHFAHLKNYLGIDDIGGSEFHQIAREQAAAAGAELTDGRVTALTRAEKGFLATTADGLGRNVDYVILNEGRKPELATALGLATDESGAIAVDADQRSSVDGVYVIGRSVRPSRSQVIISAGAGAVAAVDILSREAGQDVQDWDAPPKEDGGS